MKKGTILLTSLLTALVMSVPTSANTEIDIIKPVKVRCTCYTSTEGSITASGEHVREGIIAGKREWMHKTAILYDLDMNLIGIYEVKDTGAGMDTDGDGKGDSIKNGKSIDVYRNTLTRCYDWIKEYGDYVYLVIIDAEG
ncbi:MAG: hypothetical protein PUE12_06625 [Oscillospiraceae bacterium]|nr:hypothetical protein [Oscillospiraceae bacterium]